MAGENQLWPSMKVIFFPKGDFNVVSSRYRCYYFAEALEDNGIETRICSPPPKRTARRLLPWTIFEFLHLARKLATVGKDDIAYLQRPTQNTLFVLTLALWKLALGRKMVFDFCDPIFMHSPRKTWLLTRLADTVVVSGEDLAVWARLHNENVHIVPNSVKLDAPANTTADRSDSTECVIGWAGSAQHHKDNLRLLLPVLPHLSTNFTLRIIGARNAADVIQELEILGVPVEAVDWVEPGRAAYELSRFDIAVLPAEDKPWNQKLMTKLIDYMAAGLPVVASPVGENRSAIIDGESGYLAESETDWIEKLDRLLKDENLRRKLGKSARETVEARYSLSVNGNRLATILRDTMRNDPQSPA